MSWYYQQVLKITFSLNFILKYKKEIVIWDADTVILNKIEFFQDNLSKKYGNFFEFHKEYYLTNKNILKKLPNYFISFLNQFIAISKEECVYFVNNYIKIENLEKVPAVKIADLIIIIFITHKDYNGSMFSEYELIGQSNYILSQLQKPLLF